jgi:hypothetical protein
MAGSRGAMNVLLGILAGELHMGKLKTGTTSFVRVLLTNVPMGLATSGLRLG